MSQRQNRMVRTGFLALAALWGVAGTGGSVSAASPAVSAPAGIHGQAAQGSLRLASLARVDAQRAEAAVKAALPQARIHSVKLQVRQGFLVYRVRTVQEDVSRRTVWVDAGSGRVLGMAPPVLTGSLSAASLAKIPDARARQLALTATSGGQVLSSRLKGKGGFLVYRIRIRQSDGTLRRVMVDAGSGRILKVGKAHHAPK